MYLTGAELDWQRDLCLGLRIELYDWGALPRRTESGSYLDALALPTFRFFSSGLHACRHKPQALPA
jgi:hypothetical protein